MKEQPTGNHPVRSRTPLFVAALLASLLLAALLTAFVINPIAPSSLAQADESTATPITYAATIIPGEPMVMGDTDLTLEFEPGASGVVTVTLVPTVPIPAPVSGAISLTWNITTTATSFQVTATFSYRRVAQDADIVLVLDKSGSMGYNTLCYGCWEYNPDTMDAPEIYPLPWAAVQPADTQPPDSPDHCSTVSITYTQHETSNYWSNDFVYRYNNNENGPYYIVIEAEEYSEHTPSASYHDGTPFSTFWVMQRNGQGSKGRDVRGGYIQHSPFRAWSPSNWQHKGVSCTKTDIENGGFCRRQWSTEPAGQNAGSFSDWVPSGPLPAPRVEYDFVTPCHSNCDTWQAYYFWLRGQGGSEADTQYIYWNMDDESNVAYRDGFSTGPRQNGASSGDWDWVQLGSRSLLEGAPHKLNLWAGGAGFDVDRIIITTDNSTPPSAIQDAPANNARTRDACHYCDPRFAGWFPPDDNGDDIPDSFEPLKSSDGTRWSPWCRLSFDPGVRPDLRLDKLYEGRQPMHHAIWASKEFVAGLDPKRDQVGYIAFDSSVGGSDPCSRYRPRTELECLRQDGPAQLDNPFCSPGDCVLGVGCDADCGCFGDVISHTVIYQMDKTYPCGGTNIADGIYAGRQTLRTGSCSSAECGRPGTAKIMILLTDGYANQSSCTNPPDLVPDDPSQPAGWNTARDCAAWQAQQAAAEDITIHTITVGDGADQELMYIIAQLANGNHYHASKPEHLYELLSWISSDAILHPLSAKVTTIYHRASPTTTWMPYPVTLTQLPSEPGVPSWTITGTNITQFSQWTLGPASHLYYLPITTHSQE